MHKILINSQKLLIVTAITAIAFFVASAPTKAAVDTCTWTGGTDNLWSESGNWSCSVDGADVPENGDSLVFPGAVPNTANNNDIAGQTYVNVEISGTGYGIIGNPIAFSNTMTISGSFNDLAGGIEFDNTSAGTRLIASGAFNNISETVTFSTTGQTATIELVGGQTITTTNMSGTTENLVVEGTGNWITSTSTTSYTVNGTPTISDTATVVCRNLRCLGFGASEIVITDSGKLRFDGDGLVFVRPIELSTGTPSIETANSMTMGLSSDITSSDDDAIFEIGEDSTVEYDGLLTLTENIEITGSDFESVFGYGGSGMLGNGRLTVSTSTFNMLVNNPSFNGNIIVEDALYFVGPDGDLGTTTGSTTLNGVSIVRFGDAGEDRSFAESFFTGLEGVEGAAQLEMTGTFSTTLIGDITLDAPIIFNNQASNTSNFNIESPISGTGDVVIITANANTEVVFAGSEANTYDGLTVMEGSFLNITRSAVSIPGDVLIENDGTDNGRLLVTGSSEQIANDAIITINGTNAFARGRLTIDDEIQETIGGLAGDSFGAVEFIDEGILILDSVDNMTYAGTFEQTGAGGSFVKQGTGTLTLTGTSEDAVAYVVEEGILAVNGSLVGAAGVTVSGGILKGTGSVGQVLVEVGAIAPGMSPGVLTVSGDLELTEGVEFEAEIAGTVVGTGYDQVVVSSDVTLNNATLTVLFLDGFVPAEGDVFTILRAATISGTFAGLADGARFTVGSTLFEISYNLDNDENTVTLTVVTAEVEDDEETELPETGKPIYVYGIGAAIVAGAALAVGLRRKESLV